MINKKNIIYLIIYIFALATLTANSRVAFSRPGNMMRIPSIDSSMKKYLLSLNLSSEILSSSQSNSAFSVSAASNTGYEYGISFVKPVNPFNSIEIGFHLQKSMLIYENINWDIGAHDLLFRYGSDSSNGLDTRGISLFSVLSNEKTLDDYKISTHLGFGTGKIVQDSHLYLSNPEQKIGPFLGFQFKTPLLKKDGGVTLLTEYDGMGLNVGLYFPILKLYQINLAITRFENLGDFATEDKTAGYATLSGDAPAIILGFAVNFPRLHESNEDRIRSSYHMDRGIYSKTDSSVLFYNPICTDVVETLRDSIRFGSNVIENLEAHNLMLLHKEVVLVDSIRKNLFREEISLSKQNKAMRHLSRSLRFFYSENYPNALSEVNIAIKENPSSAIAYGRRGSIYYKLGDMRKATLNWNVALQLDPEFTEIYDMLKASDENRLKAIEISKIVDEN